MRVITIDSKLIRVRVNIDLGFHKEFKGLFVWKLFMVKFTFKLIYSVNTRASEIYRFQILLSFRVR